ncbi:MAG TPA: threonine/serine exporter family protein, partial [bacterium]|nr:threonine/serine exporter family protein [bacterium]
GRLAALYAIRDRVVAGEVSPEEGLRQVRAVLAEGGGAALADVAGQALVGGGAAALLGGGVTEVWVAAVAGVLAAWVALLARRRPSLGDVQAALTCAVVAFFVRAVATVWPLNVPVTTLAAIIVLLPGLSFTTALAELAMRHLAAGSARLMGALAVFVTMAIGVGIGDRTAAQLFGEVAPPPPAALGTLALTLALAANWVAFVLLLRGTPRQAPWVLFAVLAGFGGARTGAALLGDDLGAVVGAMAVGALANLYARFWRQPSAIVRTPGLLLLVPGSLGFSGLTTALSGDLDSSAPFVIRMLLVGGSIVAGLLFAGAVLPPPLAVEPAQRD